MYRIAFKYSGNYKIIFVHAPKRQECFYLGATQGCSLGFSEPDVAAGPVLHIAEILQWYMAWNYYSNCCVCQELIKKKPSWIIWILRRSMVFKLII